MNYKVVYFTRSGNSKRIAEKIGNKLSCQVIQITDNMNWDGVLGYIKAGFYASQNKAVDIKIHENISDSDELIVVSPLWAGGLAPAIRIFLKTITLDRIHLVVTSGGSAIKNASGFKSVNNIMKNKNNEDNVINDLVSRLS